VTDTIEPKMRLGDSDLSQFRNEIRLLRLEFLCPASDNVSENGTNRKLMVCVKVGKLAALFSMT
jgi:hypothetical protein